MKTNVRAFVVEDEPLARESLVQLIEEVPWLDTVGEAAAGPEAVTGIDRLRPDLVFLDVRLPGMSGLQVLERVTHRPAVVFTTAYDRYAVAAFEVEAVDYLVKPFGRGRFLAAVERVRARLDAPPATDDLPSDADRALEGLSRKPLGRLFARKGRRIVNVPVVEITHVAGSGDYAELHTADDSFLVQVSLTELAERLDGDRFWRVHRSHIVNLDHVATMEPFDDRRLALVLRDGHRVVASRAGSRRLRQLIR